MSDNLRGTSLRKSEVGDKVNHGEQNHELNNFDQYGIKEVKALKTKEVTALPGKGGEPRWQSLEKG